MSLRSIAQQSLVLEQEIARRSAIGSARSMFQVPRAGTWNKTDQPIQNYSLSCSKTLEHAGEDVEHDIFEERTAIIEANGIPRAWAEGLSILCSMPCPVGYPTTRWEQLINDAGLFLDQWGALAAGLGWRALDVFGVTTDALKGDYNGAGLVPLLQGRPIVEITASTALLGCNQEASITYFRGIMPPNAVAIWHLK